MPDIIKGLVTNVVDGNTFELRVTHAPGDNNGTNGKNEKIRIAEIDASESNFFTSYGAKKDLENAILDKEVRCYVQAKDENNMLIAKVEFVRYFNTFFDDY